MQRWLHLTIAVGCAGALLGCDALTSVVDKAEEEFSRTPLRILASETVVEVQASGVHACARTSDDETWCWGFNEHGALGATAASQCLGIPCARAPLLVTTRPFVQLAVSHMAQRSCALDASGSPWCWGFLAGEQNGGFPPRAAATPQLKADSLQFDRLVLEEYRNCGLRSGQLWCWGHASQGKFGNGIANTAAPNPIHLADSLHVAAMDIGWSHSCLLTDGGRTACWGSAWFGALGSGLSDGALVSAPRMVPDAPTFTQVVVGMAYSCGLTAAGVTYCWGSLPAAGSATGTISTPQQISDAPLFTRIFGGTRHACGLTASGELHCWGENDFGELGDGTTAFRTSPVRVRLPAPVAQVSDHPTCAVTTGGALYCWGPNETGQLAR